MYEWNGTSSSKTEDVLWMHGMACMCVCNVTKDDTPLHTHASMHACILK